MKSVKLYFEDLLNSNSYLEMFISGRLYLSFFIYFNHELEHAFRNLFIASQFWQ